MPPPLRTNPQFNGTRKDRRWSEGSTLLRRNGADGKPLYFMTYSCNNFEASRCEFHMTRVSTWCPPFGCLQQVLAFRRSWICYKPIATWSIHKGGRESGTIAKGRHGTSSLLCRARLCSRDLCRAACQRDDQAAWSPRCDALHAALRQ